jgi:MFS family permease
MFGLLIGSFFFGWYSDAVGRVPSLVAAGLTLLISQETNILAF